MCWPASSGVHLYLPPVSGPLNRPHYCPWTQEDQPSLPKWLSPCSSSVVMKCFERLHSTLSLLDINRGSSAFKTIGPLRLVQPVFSQSEVMRWSSVVKTGNYTLNNDDTPILLPTSCTHMIVQLHTAPTPAWNFTDDTVAWSPNNMETACLEEVELLASWCKTNNLDLNITKTKCVAAGFHFSQARTHLTQSTDRDPTNQPCKDNSVDWMSLVRCVSAWLEWKPAAQIYEVEKISPGLQKTFFSGSTATWYGNCCAQDRKSLHRVIRWWAASQELPCPAFRTFTPGGAGPERPGLWWTFTTTTTSCLWSTYTVSCPGLPLSFFSSGHSDNKLS